MTFINIDGIRINPAAITLYEEITSRTDGMNQTEILLTDGSVQFANISIAEIDKLIENINM